MGVRERVWFLLSLAALVDFIGIGCLSITFLWAEFRCTRVNVMVPGKQREKRWNIAGPVLLIVHYTKEHG